MLALAVNKYARIFEGNEMGSYEFNCSGLMSMGSREQFHIQGRAYNLYTVYVTMTR